MSSPLKVGVTDTFDFWRQQFNALVDSVGAKSYFVTPQDFGAAGDGVNDDTAAFDAANLQDKPVYIPPGRYFLTKSFDGVNKFFQFGGVIYTNGSNTVVSGFRLDPTTEFIIRKAVKGVDGTDPSHLTTKNYVDTLVTTEATARTNADNTLTTNLATEVTNRTNADTNLQNQLNLKPVSGNWWNNGLLRVNTDGGMEIGTYIDFHSSANTSADYDIRIWASKWTDYNPSLGQIDQLVFLSKNAITNPAFIVDLTNGYTTFHQGHPSAPNEIGRGMISIRHNSLSTASSSFDSYFAKQEYLRIAMNDATGGGAITGIQRVNNSGHPALMLFGVRNDDGQIPGEQGAVHVMAAGWNGSTFVDANANDNIFAVSNYGNNKFVVKGNGDLYTGSSIKMNVAGVPDYSINSARFYNLKFLNITETTASGNIVNRLNIYGSVGYDGSNESQVMSSGTVLSTGSNSIEPGLIFTVGRPISGGDSSCVVMDVSAFDAPFHHFNTTDNIFELKNFGTRTHVFGSDGTVRVAASVAQINASSGNVLTTRDYVQGAINSLIQTVYAWERALVGSKTVNQFITSGDGNLYWNGGSGGSWSDSFDLNNLWQPETTIVSEWCSGVFGSIPFSYIYQANPDDWHWSVMFARVNVYRNNILFSQNIVLLERSDFAGGTISASGSGSVSVPFSCYDVGNNNALWQVRVSCAYRANCGVAISTGNTLVSIIHKSWL